MSGKIPHAVVRRLMSAADRVGGDGVEALESHLVVYSADLTRRAKFVAAKADRQTIKAEDVEAAIKEVRR